MLLTKKVEEIPEKGVSVELGETTKDIIEVLSHMEKGEIVEFSTLEPLGRNQRPPALNCARTAAQKFPSKRFDIKTRYSKVYVQRKV